MKIIIQRVRSASVVVENKQISAIDQGLLLLVGYGRESTKDDNRILAQKLLNLRIFTNIQGKFDHSVLDVKGEILAVSQFTLYAATQKGRRPDFNLALEPEKARILFDDFLEVLNESKLKISAGIFGADMQVSLCNDGPVTIILESNKTNI